MGMGEAMPRSGEPSVNYSGFRARNLRKSDLGGAIFGCKHSTISECLQKQLFGLPAPHYAYVRNIEPGLPLFLFNYTDRMLHGVYDAAGRGQRELDPYAWTEGGNERTPFPAQVRICMKTCCLPIPEKEFEPIIRDNYYSPKHFYFELDHRQVNLLKFLFKPTLQAGNIQVPPSLGIAKKFTRAFPHGKEVRGMSLVRTWKDAIVSGQEPKSDVDVVSGNRYASLWDDEDNQSAKICKTSTSDSENNDAENNNREDEENKEPVSDWEDLCSSGNVVLQPDAKFVADDRNQVVSLHKPVEREVNKEEYRVLDKLQKLAIAYTSCCPSSSGCADDLGISLVPEGEGTIEANKQLAVIPEKNPTTLSTCSHVELEACSTMEEVKKLKEEVKKLKEEMQQKQIEYERENMRLKETIHRLMERVKELEIKSDPSMALVEDSLNASLLEHFLGSEKLIYLIGGYDGNSWLKSLDSYSLSLDVLTPLRPMTSPRSYASAAALDGCLYVFGGGSDNLWYKTAECYNPQTDEWSSCPSLAWEKGCLAGASLDGKIFALGGGDGKNSFSDVEMLDPILGRWIRSPSMLQKRFAPAAAVFNGSLYAVGGFDGQDYLSSAERYDPREISWNPIPSMKTRRGSHSLVLFNEKLYALGGYDGDQMVSSVEVFDPRVGTWMMGEPMNMVRGYASPAVLGDSLFVLGGIKDSDSLVDAVECYREGVGWEVTRLKAVGTRCFFSAIVL